MSMVRLGISLLVLLHCRQDDPSKRAKLLAEKLRSDNVEERDAASRTLKKMGQEAVAALSLLKSDPDVEVAERAHQLLRVLRILDVLSPGILKSMPGVEERLAQGPERVWVDVFLEAAGEDQRGKRTHPELKRE